MEPVPLVQAGRILEGGPKVLFQKVAFSVSAAILMSASVFAQTQSSSVLGTVIDPAGASVPSASVTLTNTGTSAVNRATTDSGGLFRITNILTGNYSVKIEAKGFKTFTVSDIAIGAGDTRDLGKLSLALGSAAESISVTAEMAAVQTASSERAPLIDTADDLNVVAIKGRDMMSYMKLLPGVVDTNNGRDASGGSILGSLTFSGNTGIVGYSVDGATDMDTGCASCFAHFEPNIDAISEVKVLTSNFAAEYGRNSGATISVTTKSGTQQFHGSAWWTHRHEEFNANTFFNNQTGVGRPRYRYNIPGWSFGGPVYIPGHFNKNKTKLFAFGSQEYTRQFLPVNTQYRSMPTKLERAGDFSQSFLAPTTAQAAAGQTGSLIVVKDPLNNKTQFPGNVIPANRFNGWGLSMLNFFPLPNAQFNPGTAQFGQDNYQETASGTHPRRNDILRVDVVATSKLNGYFRYGHDFDTSDTLFAISQFNTGNIKHPNPGTGMVTTVNYTFSPTLVNQATYNFSYNYFSYYEDNPAQIARTLLNGAAGTPQAGQPLPSLFPLHPIGPGVGGELLEGPGNCSNGYCNYIPNFSFGGSTPPNAASGNGQANQIDYVNTNRIKQFSDNLSKIWGNHSIKAGIYVEYNRKLQPGGPSYLGNYSFSQDNNNPLDSGDAYANALLGNYDSYNENSAHFVYNVFYWNTEFFLQDDWRVGKRLTLNYGVRFYHLSPQIDLNKEFGYFDPARYKASAAPRIYTPKCLTTNPCSGANRVGVDPATGATVPAAQIGLFVPNSGDYANGMVVAGVNGVPLDTYTNAYIVVSPRIGFAYDVFGDGKTALRGGFGTFYDRLDGNQVYSMSGLPPLGYQPTALYGTIASLATTQGLFGPSNFTQWTGYTPVPQSRSASLGIQHNFWGTLVDVSYQGTWGLNRNLTANINSIPLGRDYDPAFHDPTSANNANTGQQAFLTTSLLRTNYPGSGAISVRTFNGRSDYEGLQVNIKRRMSKGLLWTAAYTYSHSFSLAAFDPLVTDARARNWGPQNSDRRHILQISYAYDLPKVGKMLRSKPLGALTDGWNLSGIASFSTGSPFTPGFNWTDNRDITGSSNEGARINVIGDPHANVPQGTPGLPHGVINFNPAAFASPLAYPIAGYASIGNAGVNIMQGPGYANFDMTLDRKINLHSEKRQLQLKVEAFNVFNHVQFTGVNSTFNFSAVTNLNTNANIGALTGERGARILASEIRIQF